MPTATPHTTTAPSRATRTLALLALVLSAACNRDWTFITNRDAGAAALACADQDLGSAVRQGVATGTTAGTGNELTATCGSSAMSEEVAFTWTAPTSGMFTFDTVGSDFDTVLHMYANTACSGTALACDDDSGGSGGASRITRAVIAGERLVIVVDGYGSNRTGNFVLNIRSGS